MIPFFIDFEDNTARVVRMTLYADQMTNTKP